MKPVEEIQAIVRQHQSVLQARYGVLVTGIFGSYVRGEQQQSSDVDLLVEIIHPISLLELVGAELYLSEILGIKVDLVPKRSIREELREVILSEVVEV
ncbi:MAG TPA: nucleotidyltransferase family protein [Anaerolineales bacterium]|nr:nucleotidyltransferase family protein [Anaerolineales bacterium]